MGNANERVSGAELTSKGDENQMEWKVEVVNVRCTCTAAEATKALAKVGLGAEKAAKLIGSWENMCGGRSKYRKSLANSNSNNQSQSRQTNSNHGSQNELNSSTSASVSSSTASSSGSVQDHSVDSLADALSFVVERNTFEREVHVLEKELGLSELSATPFMERLYALLDANGDGVLEAAEFYTAFYKLFGDDVEREVHRCWLLFALLDSDQDGRLVADDLVTVVTAAWGGGMRELVVEQLARDMLDPTDRVDELVMLSDDIACQFALRTFAQLDVQQRGYVLFDRHFVSWAKQRPRITVTLNGHSRDVPIYV
jgi:Ca2+-binding EF-hand superfamily protein